MGVGDCNFLDEFRDAGVRLSESAGGAMVEKVRKIVQSWVIRSVSGLNSCREKDLTWKVRSFSREWQL